MKSRNKARSKSKHQKGAKRPSSHKPAEIHIAELTTILERAKSVLSVDDHDKLKAAMDTLVFLTQELEAKGASIKRLRRLLFGASTEKTSEVLAEHEPVATGQDGDESDPGSADSGCPADNGSEKRGTESGGDSEKHNGGDEAQQGQGPSEDQEPKKARSWSQSGIRV